MFIIRLYFKMEPTCFAQRHCTVNRTISISFFTTEHMLKLLRTRF